MLPPIFRYVAPDPLGGFFFVLVVVFFFIIMNFFIKNYTFLLTLDLFVSTIILGGSGNLHPIQKSKSGDSQ